MNHGVTVYAPDGVTEVFNGKSRTFKMVKKIPFTRALRFSTTYHEDPLFLEEDPVWFYTDGYNTSDLIDVTFSNGVAAVTVTTYYGLKREGRYEITDPNPWPAEGHSYIVLGVY